MSRLPDLTDSLKAAKSLLGWKLIHETNEGRVGGFIIETEAYNQNDSASHTFRGESTRNAAMFERAGTIYVYFTYGKHYCMNIVTGPPGRGEAVLIRALEPVEGLREMRRRRGLDSEIRLTNGPAKLVQALGVSRQHNGTHLDDGTLKLEPGFTPEKITRTSRVGISKAQDKPWRFYVAGNRFVS